MLLKRDGHSDGEDDDGGDLLAVSQVVGKSDRKTGGLGLEIFPSFRGNKIQ